MTLTETQEEIEFWKAARTNLRKTYLKLTEEYTKSYKLADREAVRLEMEKVSNELEKADKKLNELAALENGQRPRKAFAAFIRDF